MSFGCEQDAPKLAVPTVEPGSLSRACRDLELPIGFGVPRLSLVVWVTETLCAVCCGKQSRTGGANRKEKEKEEEKTTDRKSTDLHQAGKNKKHK